MKTQREAVYTAVIAICGEVKGKVELSGDTKKAVEQHVFDQFKAGEVRYNGGIPEDAQLKKYVNGLVNNWVRKDTNLNGGVKYEAKNPGSRTGSGDETLRAMKDLLSTLSDPAQKATVQQEIEKRKAQLAAAKQPAIKVEALPESLRHLAPTA